MMDAATAGIIVAGITTAGTLAKVALTQRHVAKSIGTPNGQGNIVQMMERLLAGQTGQDVRLARLEHLASSNRNRLDSMEGKLR